MRYGPILARSFYARSTVQVARDLLGKVMVHGPTAGIIVETEAYLGGDDLAAHSARGLTGRTRVIFGPPGHAYVYLIYGMYECLNLVAEADGRPGCVLIRAMEPVVRRGTHAAPSRGRAEGGATRQRSREAYSRPGHHARLQWGGCHARGPGGARAGVSRRGCGAGHAAHRDHAVRGPAAALRSGGQSVRE